MHLSRAKKIPKKIQNFATKMKAQLDLMAVSSGVGCWAKLAASAPATP
jgi:hypothetical protein